MDKKHPYSVHKIKYADFIEKNYPKFDLYSKEPIKWKSDEQYHLSDFNNKINLKKYLEGINKDEVFHYLKGWLMRRVLVKNIEIASGEFEIKSLPFPSLSYLEKKYGAEFYNRICSEIGLQIKYNYLDTITFNKNIESLDYICDTREQAILKLPNMQIAKLYAGDYNLSGSNIYIERKSLPDFIGTMSSGYERFTKEIERIKERNDYLVILIEEKYSNLLGFEYLPHIRSKCDFTFVSHRFRELISKYPFNIQFICVDGRKEAVRVIQKIYKLDNNINSVDLQYAYNKGEL